jgi:hypothetical protein
LQGVLTKMCTVNIGNSNSPGVLTIKGSYTQTAGGALQVEIASALSYDQLKVISAPGTVSLNGRLSPILLNGYHPQIGQIFPGVVTATGGVSSAFSSAGSFSPHPDGPARVFGQPA